jgi:hypothetical protein
MKPVPKVRDLERIHGITWRELAELEPRLVDLLWEARQACVNCRRWSDVDRAFAPLREALAELVGFGGENHRHPVLGSAGAYQVVYWKLFDAVALLLLARASSADGPPKTRREGVAGTHPAESPTTPAARV